MNESDASPIEPSPAEETPPVEPESTGQTPVLTCRQCGSPRPDGAGYCADCGYIFSDEPVAPAGEPISDKLLAGRYRLFELIADRDGVARFRGVDLGDPDRPLPITIVRQEATTPTPVPSPDGVETSILEFDLPMVGDQPTIEISPMGDVHAWPGVAWEQGILLRAAHLSLPRLMDSFAEDGFAYLIEEVPSGTPLWDAWDREGVTNRERFTWMVQLAEALDRLHHAGAILEGLRPEMVVVLPSGMATLADVGDLLPIPLPGDVPLRGGYYTAPELLLNPQDADGRADLYAFGAMLYALVLGRELTDLDFTLTGMPRPYLERVPDANPFLARVLTKTFVREISERFPSDDAGPGDPTGFRELIESLDACRRSLDRVRIDVAAWSTTGTIRTGNEDAVFVHHTTDHSLDGSDEAALILLADGMGGMECGEVAARMALDTLKECLLTAPPFGPPPAAAPVPLPEPPVTRLGDMPEFESGEKTVDDLSPPLLGGGPGSPERSPEAHAERISAAFHEANHRIFEAAHASSQTRGMGCTTEVVLIDGGTAIVGHVGDSRVYRMHQGKLSQVTRDHTVVGRLVETGHITEEEAAVHPRRFELQQAVGGRPDVYPDIYAVTIEPGDWLVVCSDGLSNQTPNDVMQAVLREARNAERAARRFVNMTLAEGAMDNVTVAVIRFS